MFGLTKKTLIAACMVVCYSGQFCAFGAVSDSELDDVGVEHPMITPVTKPIERQVQQLEARAQVWQRELKDVGGKKRHQRSRKDHLTNLIAETQDDLKRISKRQRTSINAVPSEVMCAIFELIASSGDSNPRILSLVCSDWRAYFYDSGSDKDKEASWYSRMNSYGKKLMKIWWLSTIGGYDSRYDEIYERFLNGKLIYKPNPDSNNGIVTLKISDLPNPFNGTFDLSGCGCAAEYLVITTNISDFFAPHLNKIVIGLFPHWLVNNKIATTSSHFNDIMEEWDEVKAPMGIFWRWGRWSDLTWFDHLTQATLPAISSRNLFKNWATSTYGPRARFRTNHSPYAQKGTNFMFVFELK